MKIRQGALVENIYLNLCAKFYDDRLWNEKALVLWASDNNPKNKHKNKNINDNIRGHWEPVFRSKNVSSGKSVCYRT